MNDSLPIRESVRENEVPNRMRLNYVAGMRAKRETNRMLNAVTMPHLCLEMEELPVRKQSCTLPMRS